MPRWTMEGISDPSNVGITVVGQAVDFVGNKKVDAKMAGVIVKPDNTGIATILVRTGDVREYELVTRKLGKIITTLLELAPKDGVLPERD